jgi:hypothetical protein
MMLSEKWYQQFVFFQYPFFTTVNIQGLFVELL